MSKQGKHWGETTEFFRNSLVSAHHLSIKAGGYCSKHRHTHKYNLFYVMSGSLLIEIWRDNAGLGQPDRTLVTEGQATAVAPGFYHRFQAVKKAEVIEVYQVLLNEPDIERLDQGGVKP